MDLFKRFRKPEPIVLGAAYFHVDQDPFDMIACVVPSGIHGDTVFYRKFYKNNVSPMARDSATIVEFNRYYRKEV